MALLKFINMAKKKKSKIKDNLSTILSQGAEEDNASEAAFKTKRATQKLIEEFSQNGDQDDILPTINELIDSRPLIAGKMYLTRRQTTPRDA